MRPVHSILTAGILSAALGSYAMALTLPVSEDTSAHKRSGRLTRATGTARSLVASSTRPALVRFDLSALPAGVTAANITSVTLRLYVIKATGAPDAVRVVPATSNWHESDDGAVPSADDDGAVFASGPVAAARFISADVTAAVRSALGGGPNFGFLITTDVGSILLGAKEGPSAGYAAELDIESDPVPTTLGSDSVVSDTISNRSVTSGKLGEGAVTNAALGDGSVTAAKLGSGAVTSATLGDGSVTAAKLASNLTLGGTTTIGGRLDLPDTTSSSVGVIRLGGTPVLHGYGGASFFIGPRAGNFTLTGAGHTGVGGNALNRLTSGTNCTAVGDGAVRDNTTGSQNVGVGSNALILNSTGSGNVAVGVASLQSNSGSNNVAIGDGAGFNLTTGSNNICIGASVSGVAGDSNRCRIGQIRGRTTGVNDAVAVVIDSTGQLGTVSSSRRYKQDIADMGDASARLSGLRPVTFRYKEPCADGSTPVQFGLIAEEVAEAFPELAVFDVEGRPETVKYRDLVPMLLNEFLRERRRADAQATTIADQERHISALAAKVAALELRDGEREARLLRIEGALLGRPAVDVGTAPEPR